MDEFLHLLRRVAASVAEAQAFYQTWFTFRGDNKALPTYYHDMNDYRYVDFFNTVNAGTYQLMYIALGCLFDTDDRAASIRNLRMELEGKGRKDLADKIELELSPYTDLVRSIMTIRAQLIAHKQRSAFSEKVHEGNEVVPDEVGRLIEKCCVLVNEVYEEFYNGGGTRLCSAETRRFENAAFNMLDVLRNGRS